MIIDTHQHFWHYDASEYDWIDEQMRILQKDYLPVDLEPLLKDEGVGGTVAVQARQQPEETGWLLELAEANPFILGVVGWADLRAGDLEARLAAFSNHSKLVGLRHVIHDEPDDDFMLRPDFMRGIEKLGRQQLVYDLLIFPKHLSRAYELVRRFPEQTFVLDHLAKPPIREGRLQPWEDDLRLLASLPNVWCKISGMVTEADPEHWNREQFAPYLDVVTGAFGTDRLMLGSDWPVCLLAAEYGEVMRLAGDYFEGLDAGSKEKIYRTNPLQCYRLKLP